MRVAIGGLSHESSTFTPVQTTRQSYQERFLLDGDAVLQTFHRTNTPIGGFIAGAQAHDFETDSDPFRLAPAQRADPASAL